MTSYAPLLGIGATFGPAADLYRRQQEALRIAYEESEKHPEIGRMVPAIEAYLKAMRESEAMPSGVCRMALEEIRFNTRGAVCEDYDLCEHESCRASYAAWAIADRALTEAAAEA